MTGRERFDKAAATWDLAERRVLLAHEVAAALATRVTLSKGLSVLDFGCGTGLLTLELGSMVGSIAGADTSPGMLKALEEKARTQGLSVPLIQLDGSGAGDLGGPYDLITSSMTLHHIADVPSLLRRFAGLLVSGGLVALADLDEEDGSFHEDGAGFHHPGFKRPEIQAWLECAGFHEVSIETATVTRKDGKDYTVFLAIARRKGNVAPKLRTRPLDEPGTASLDLGTSVQFRLHDS